MPKFQTQVGPLKRGYKYEFKVRPYGSNLYGRESNTQDLRVPEIGENLTRTSCNNLLLCVHQQCYGVYCKLFLLSTQCTPVGCVHDGEP